MKLTSSKYLLWSFIAIYFVFFSVITSLRHYNFETQTWDLGAFEQSMWNAAGGRGFTNNLEEAPHHFGVHFSPFMYVLLPFYFLFQSPYFLLIIQTLALALGAWPLFLLSNKILGDEKFSLLLAGSYLLYPALHWVNWFDFHPISFLPPLLITAVYFLELDRWVLGAIFLALAASTQEDAILAALFVGVFYAVARRKWKFGGISALVLLAYFIVTIQFFMPAFGGGLLRLDRYAHLGRSPTEIIANIFQNPKLLADSAFTGSKFLYFVWLFLPVLFLPFYSGWAFLLLIPGIFENSPTNFGFQYSGFYQYDSVLIGAIFVSLVFALKKLIARWPDKKKIFYWALLAASLLGFLLRSPVKPTSFPFEFFQADAHEATFREILKYIPPEASVAAHTNLVPHLAHREHIYMAGYEPFMAEFVILDGADYFGFFTPQGFQEYADKYMMSGKYTLDIVADRYYVIFDKKYLK